MKATIRYKGYEVAPSAQALPNGLYAANLTIGTLGIQSGTPSSNASNVSNASNARPSQKIVSFDALDYFFDERHALAYACRWARMWIDEQRRCA
ncbi:transcriptional regulator [Paraburkholderia bannensis]|uniref:transcriptional regulator n=1 Tax=Paraburkholderia bannensis TaxID=765414 RepID=UPI002AC33810|nr:transcriptional regulator [Paraburkholderia bannensis]